MASAKSRKLAVKYQKMLERVTKKGVTVSNRLSMGLYKDLIKQFKDSNYDFQPTIDKYSTAFTAQVEIGAIIAHMIGMVMYNRELAKQTPETTHLAEKEDMQNMLLRAGINPTGLATTQAIEPSLELFEGLAEELDLSAIERQRIANRYATTARTAGKEFTKRLTSRLSVSIVDIVSQELTEAQALKEIKRAFQLAGVSARHDYWYTTIYRTETQIAMAGGRWQSANDPISGELLWGFEYVTMGDQHVRPLHVQADGTVLPKDDLWWNINFPPCGFNCRCIAIEIFEKEKVKRSDVINVNDSPNFETDWQARPVVEGI